MSENTPSFEDWVLIKNESNGKFLDVCAAEGSGTPVIIFALHGGKNQQWKFERTGNGWFFIVSRMSPQLASLSPFTSCLMNNFSVLFNRKYPAKANQLFKVEDGYITSSLNGLVLDIDPAKCKRDETKIMLNQRSDAKSQAWSFQTNWDILKQNPPVPLFIPLDIFGIDYQVTVIGTPLLKEQFINLWVKC